MPDEKTVLLVEDDTVDAMAVKRAFKELDMPDCVALAKNGEEALEYLRDGSNNTPRFVLLDLNMPRMGGVEFMRIVKSDDGLKKIPIIVLTTSKADQDRIETFGLGVSGYIIKPVDHSQLVDTIRKIGDYWKLTEFPDDY